MATVFAVCIKYMKIFYNYLLIRVRLVPFFQRQLYVICGLNIVWGKKFGPFSDIRIVKMRIVNTILDHENFGNIF
jgi:hypothetical protein